MGTQKGTAQARLLRKAFANASKAQGMKELAFKEISHHFSDAPPCVASFAVFQDDDGVEYFATIDLDQIRKMKTAVAKAKNAIALAGICSNPGLIHSAR